MLVLLRLIVVLALGGAGLAVSTVAVAPYAQDLLGAGQLDYPDLNLDQLAQRSLAFAADGSVLAVLHAEENRVNVILDDVPDQVIDTILAVEDAEFYAHEGVNVRAIVRALFENVSAGAIEEGASTITQQVVKNSFLTPEREINRKTREIILAIELERQLSKDEILERYLNTVYFGGGAYGVGAAAELYWESGIDALDWPEAALLAGIISNPVANDPILNPEAALAQRQLALDRIVELGYISQDQADLYATAPLPVQRAEVFREPDDYFIEEVKQRLLDDERLGETEAERFNAVFRGGLRIHTTFEPQTQALALFARASEIPDTGGQFTVALAAIESSTGAVRALLGGPGFDNYKFNLATQGLRQTGSSWKTFVLVAALENGFVPSDTISGASPCSFPNPGGTPDPYVAQNFGGSRGGTGTLTRQTTGSVNCAYLRLGQAVGLDKVADTAHAMGITSPLDPAVLSMPLGVFEVSPLEMAAGYSTIVSGGIQRDPYFIERVENNLGEVLWEHEDVGERAISGESACLASSVLEQNVIGGTGTRARLPNQEVAGKTGTAQRFEDALFIGFSPYLTAAVWMGAPEAKIPMTNVGGRSVTGGSYPAQMWGAFMSAYHEDKEPLPLCDPGPTRPGRAIKSDLPELIAPCGPGQAAQDEDGDGAADTCLEFDPSSLCDPGLDPLDLDGDGIPDVCVGTSPVQAPPPPPPTAPPTVPPPTTTVPPPPTTTTSVP